MYGIEVLMEEHQNILKFTDYIKKICCEALEGKELVFEQFEECIAFARNYADKQHHGKEEEILFRIMIENMGSVAEKVITYGMHVEHDLGRLHVAELEKNLLAYKQDATVIHKLEIITNASAYANLLRRHIEKEDEVIFPFAERNLIPEWKNQVDQETKEFETICITKEWSFI